MSYLTRALLEAATVGATCGAVGVQVVLRRLGFAAATLAHATFPGAVLAGVLGLAVYAGAGATAAVAVLALALRRLDLGVVLAGSLALGVVIASASTGTSRDVAAYLVGHLLTVQTSDLLAAAVAAAVVGLALTLAGKELLLAAFDRTALAAQGYPVRALDLLVLGLVGVTVLAAIPAVGTVLVLALLTAPAAAARRCTADPARLTALAAAFGAVSGVAGLALSHRYDLAGGPAVILAGCALLALAGTLTSVSRR